MGRINIWIVLLLASVLLNGVLLGAGARDWFGPEAAPEGRLGEDRRGGGRPGGRGSFDLRRFVEALPEDARAEARGRFDAARPELRGLTSDMMEARRTALRLLAADRFDARAAADALAGARQARVELETATERVVLETVADLDPDTRRAVLRAALGPSRFAGPDRQRDRREPAPQLEERPD